VKQMMVFVAVLTAVLAVATTTWAAGPMQEATQDRSTSGPFVFQAEVLEVGNGWLEVKTVAVEPGSDLRANRRLLIFETADTKFLMAGEAASNADVKVGEMVGIAGTIDDMAYQANSISVIP